MKLERLFRALAPLALALPASAQLDATYWFGSTWAEREQACTALEIVTYAQFGTITLKPDFTFTLASSDYQVCSGGQTTTAPAALVGTYTYDAFRTLVLDFDPTLPGTDVATVQLVWDERLGVLNQPSPGAPTLAVLVRQGAGLGPASVNGPYGLVRSSLLQIPGGLQSEAQLGSIGFDGAGGYQVSASWRRMTPSTDTTGTDPVSSGAYTLAANGLFSTGGGTPVGAVTDDGSFGFELDFTGSRTGLTLFARKPLTAPSAAAIDGAWYLEDLGAEQTLEIEPGASSGVMTSTYFGPTWAYFGTHSFADTPTGGGSQPDSRSGTFTVATDGALSFAPAPTVDGWLAASEDVFLYADLSVAGSAAAGIGMRAWAPFGGDATGMSVATGGTQLLRMRAGGANIGKLFLVMGSVSGTTPGVPFGSWLVPLNYDPYALFALVNPNTPPLSNSFGTLDALGESYTQFTVPAGAWTSLVGVTVDHACLVLNTSAAAPLALVSNPVPLTLQP